MAHTQNCNAGFTGFITEHSRRPFAAGLAVACLVVGAGIARGMLALDLIPVATTWLVTAVGAGIGVLVGAIVYLLPAKLYTQSSSLSGVPLPAVFRTRRRKMQRSRTPKNRLDAAGVGSAVTSAASQPIPAGSRLFDLSHAPEARQREAPPSSNDKVTAIRPPTSPLDPGAGVDLHAFPDDLLHLAETSIVEFKAWAAQRVGNKSLREALDEVNAKRASHQSATETDDHTNVAALFTLGDGNAPSERRVKRLPPDAQQRPLKSTTKADISGAASRRTWRHQDGAK